MGSSNSSHVGRKLERYRAKRSAGKTPEPFGSEARARPRQFCVQKHAATRLHWDFRLELGGVLLSWAVPKGPSADPNEKRLAVHVEDHPVEYADFEGVIPEDNYGAGQVIVWDKGLWTALEDPEEGLKKGKLLFELKGYKLRGVWTLVRTKTKGRGDAVSKDWLLIKHRDQYSSPTTVYSDESVLSGLTLEEVGQGRARADSIHAQLTKLGAPKRNVKLADIQPMLAEARDEAFSRPGWIFELKYDGFRLFGAREDGRARLQYRRGLDSTATFPDLTRALQSLPCESVILDGEVVVPDDQSRPSFHRLQQRTQLTRALDIERAAVEYPAQYYIFDLLAFEGFDLRGLPLITRKELLKALLPRVGPLRYADHLEERGREMLEEVARLGLEGIVGKKADSTYRGGRSAEWLKFRLQKSGDFVVVGYSPPNRGRVGAGALHVAAWRDDELVFVTSVGNGFADAQLLEAVKLADANRRDTPAFAGPLPEGRGHVWCEPKQVLEVRYKQWTIDNRLREPVFLQFRPDKSPADCDHVPPAHDEPSAPSMPIAAEAPPAPPPVEKTIHFINLDKVFWPEEGYTKGDLIEFYRAASPWLLHYLRDRPVVLTRYPDGIDGKSFFQKDAPGFVPPWIRTERMWSEQAQREIDYFVCDDAESLLYLINLGTIPLHVWGSRVRSLETPDWCVLDLDPKGAPFSDVIKLALAVGELCDEIELPSYVKTSGSTGLHVLVPLGRQCTFEQGRSIGELISRVIVQRVPEIATMTRVIDKRGGKVYLDYLQNGHGRLLAAPLSARPVPGALVSTPLKWSEVNQKLDATKFNIKTVPPRLKRMKKDPFAPVVDEEPDLAGALARLAERMK
ncbi:MAG TPA: DNA ligase D [Polyangia bacterium]|nr:DNA ligase D [Polyangia bacterium]